MSWPKKHGFSNPSRTTEDDRHGFDHGIGWRVTHPASGYGPLLAEFLPLLTPDAGDHAYWIDRDGVAVVHLPLPAHAMPRRTARATELVRLTRERHSAEAAESQGSARVLAVGNAAGAQTWAFIKIDEGPWLPADEVGGFDASAWDWDVHLERLRTYLDAFVANGSRIHQLL